MALPDPELELLCELLTDDPSADVFMQVARELIDRTEWDDAVDVLVNAMDNGGDGGWELLAEAALKAGQYLRALSALRNVDTDPETGEEMARLHVLALEGTGKLAEATEAAEEFLDHHPMDVVVQAVSERLSAPPPEGTKRHSDPLVSVNRAEEYAAMGRPDRALRVYRRLAYHHPQDRGIANRVNALVGLPSDIADDLSEEMSREVLRQAAPPDFIMPLPGAGLAPDGEITDDDVAPDAETIRDWDEDPDSELTDPAIDLDIEMIRREIEARKLEALEDAPTKLYDPPAGGDALGDADEETTVLMAVPASDETPGAVEKRIAAAKEKKRRSLIRR